MSEDYEKQMIEIWKDVKNLKMILDSLQKPIYDKLDACGQPKHDILWYLNAMKEDMRNSLLCWNDEGEYISNLVACSTSKLSIR